MFTHKGVAIGASRKESLLEFGFLAYYTQLIDEFLHSRVGRTYLNVLDQLLAIIFHWAPERKAGGRLTSRKAFVAYADVCFREFGDRVLHWTTFNEPNVFAHYGYDFGILQPNRCSAPFGTSCTKGNSSTEPYIVAHNIILAHAATARLYSKKYKVVGEMEKRWEGNFDIVGKSSYLKLGNAQVRECSCSGHPVCLLLNKS